MRHNDFIPVHEQLRIDPRIIRKGYTFPCIMNTSPQTIFRGKPHAVGRQRQMRNVACVGFAQKLLSCANGFLGRTVVMHKLPRIRICNGPHVLIRAHYEKLVLRSWLEGAGHINGSLRGVYMNALEIRQP